MSKLRILDLFSGIGGFSLGLERTGGFQTVAFCEIDPYCQAVLKKHWPDVPCHDDVTTMQFEKGQADVITAGFPCQDISFAGAGAGLAGERSGLYREVVRAIRVVRPLYAILENVAALLGRGLGRVLADLAEIGYDAEWHCIPAVALGACHERDWVWIVTYPDRGWGRTNPARRDNANWTNAGRAKADCLLGTLPQPDRQWYLADSDITDDSRERRRQYHGAEVAVSPQVSGLAGDIDHDGWNTPWPRFFADVCRVDDGLSRRMDKSGFERLGNAICPAIPEIIAEAILASLTAQNGRSYGDASNPLSARHAPSSQASNSGRAA